MSELDIAVVQFGGPFFNPSFEIVADTGVTKGYCLVADCGEGQLAYQLAKQTDLKIVGIERDPAAILRKVAHAIDPTISEQLILLAAKSRLRRFARSLQDVPPTSIEALTGLKSANKRLGLISNADTTEVAAWPTSPLAPFFDSTIMSCDVGEKKPDRAIYELSLKQLNLKPEEVVFVGDGGSHELKGAKSVGLTTVMMRGIIQRLYPELIEQRRPHADYEIDVLTELVP